MKRALLIGIDAYDSFPTLSGCVNDVNAMEPLLARHANGDPNFMCRTLVSGDAPVTRRMILQALTDTLAAGAEVALVYFAGHGIALTNDVGLASSDGDATEPGIPLSQVLGKVQSSPVKQIIVILDCCHAGGGGSSGMFGANIAVLRDGLALMAAAGAAQTAMETPDGRGQFSFYLCGALDGGAADATGKVTLAGVYAYIAECFGAWDQRPTFKANLDEAFDLRRTTPFLPMDSLRLLPKIFSSVGDELQLDPTFERESEHAVPANVAIYDTLTHYRDARLIELVGTQYLYYAAMESKSCRLNPHGRHYWQLASKGLL